MIGKIECEVKGDYLYRVWDCPQVVLFLDANNSPGVIYYKSYPIFEGGQQIYQIVH